MSSGTSKLEEVAVHWRTARRLYPIYSALIRQFGIDAEPCRELESPINRSEPEVIARVNDWYDEMDEKIEVAQLRQLVQSTRLATNENLSDLIRRHLDKPDKSEAVRDKLDYLCVQYYAHCAPPGEASGTTIAQVKEVLKTVLGDFSDAQSKFGASLEAVLATLDRCGSLGDLLEHRILETARQIKKDTGKQYFEPQVLVEFARYNFVFRHGFFRLMHADLNAIRQGLAAMEQRGIKFADCSLAGLSAEERIDGIRRVCNEWKKPSRAAYTAGHGFQQLVEIRDAIQIALRQPAPIPTEENLPPAPVAIEPPSPPVPQEFAVETPHAADILPPPPESPVAVEQASVKSAPVLKVADAKPAPAAKPASKTVAPVVEKANAISLVPPQSVKTAEPEKVSHTVKTAVPTKPVPPAKVETPAKVVPAAKVETTAKIVATAKPAPLGIPAAAKATVAIATAKPAAPATKPPAPMVQIPAVAVPPQNVSRKPIKPEAALELFDSAKFDSCLEYIARQLLEVPLKSAAVTTVALGGTKLLLASWEVAAFVRGGDDASDAIQRAVAARAILHLAVNRRNEGITTDLAASLSLAHVEAAKIQEQVAAAKDAKNIDAAVNLAATAKRLLGLIDEAEKARE